MLQTFGRDMAAGRELVRQPGFTPALQVSTASSMCSCTTVVQAAGKRHPPLQKLPRSPFSGARRLAAADTAVHRSSRRARWCAASSASGPPAEQSGAASLTDDSAADADIDRATDAAALPGSVEVLYGPVAAFGVALAAQQQAAFVAAQQEIQQKQQEADAQQQGVRQGQPQAPVAAQQSSDATIAGAGAAAGAAAAFAACAALAAPAAKGGQSPAQQPSGASAGGDAASSAAADDTVAADSSRPAGLGGLDMAAAVRERLAQAAKYRQVGRADTVCCMWCNTQLLHPQAMHLLAATGPAIGLRERGPQPSVVGFSEAETLEFKGCGTCSASTGKE